MSPEKKKEEKKSTMASRSGSSRCAYCHKELRTDSAMKRHIAATPRCKHIWEKEIMAAAFNETGTRKTASAHLEFDGSALDPANTWDDLNFFVPEASPKQGSCVDDMDEEVLDLEREGRDTKS